MPFTSLTPSRRSFLIGTASGVIAGAGMTVGLSRAHAEPSAAYLVPRRSGSTSGLYRRLPRDRAATRLRDVFDFIDPAWITDIRNGTDTHDLTARLNAAVASGEDLLIGAGKFNVTDTVSMVAAHQRIVTAADQTIIAVGPNFNLRAGSVLKTTHYAKLDPLRFDFQQPALPGTDYSDLIRYPWAVDISQAIRGTYYGFTLNGAWDGINGKGNAGGTTIWSVNDGSIHCGFDIDGALDFIDIVDHESWVFDYAGTVVEKLVYAHPGYCRIGKNDGFHGSLLKFWKKALRFEGASPMLTSTIDTLKFDGGNCQLAATAGDLLIGKMNHFTDANLSTLVNRGATISIGLIGLEGVPTLDSPAPLIVNASGTTQIRGGYIRAPNSTIAAQVNGGLLDVSGVRFGDTLDYPRTRPLVRQAGGTLRITECVAPDRGAGSGNFVEILTATGLFHRVSGNAFQGMGLKLPAGTAPNQFGANVGVGPTS